MIVYKVVRETEDMLHSLTLLKGVAGCVIYGFLPFKVEEAPKAVPAHQCGPLAAFESLRCTEQFIDAYVDYRGGPIHIFSAEAELWEAPRTRGMLGSMGSLWRMAMGNVLDCRSYLPYGTVLCSSIKLLEGA